MNCSKCNSAIPDGSKFCPVCGAKVEQAAGKFCTNCGSALAAGMMFCAECGTSVQAAAPAPTPVNDTPAASAVPTPVNDTPAVNAVPMPTNDIGTPAPVPVAAPVSGIDLNKGGAAVAVNEAPVANSVPAPVNDVPAASVVPTPVNDAPVASAVPAPVNDAPAVSAVPTPVNDALATSAVPTPVYDATVASAVPTPVNDTPAVNAVPMPTNDIGAPAAAPMTAGTTAPAGAVDLNKGGMTAPAADMGMSAASAVVAAPVKKKKIGLWIGVGAAAVVAIAGAVVGFCFRGVAANLVMGNNKYARMVEGEGIKSVSQNLDSASENPEVKEAMSMAMGSAITTLNTMRETNSDMDYSEMTSANFNFGWDQMVDMDYSAMMKAYGMNSATVTFDTDIKLTEAGKEALGISGDEIDEVLDMINDSKLEVSATASEKSMDAYIGITDGTGFKLDAKGIVCSDGHIGIMLPFASDKCLAFKFEENESASELVATVEFELDPKELNRLYSELAEIYLTYYENGETTVTGGSEVTAAGITQKGRLISVTIPGDKIKMMVGDMMKHVAYDEYILSKTDEFAKAIGEEFNADEFKSQADTAVEDMEDAPFSITVDTLVDFNGNILAKSYAITNSDGFDTENDSDEDDTADMMQSLEKDVKTVKLIMLSKDNQSAVSVFTDSKELMFARLTAKNETDGTVRVEVLDDSMTVGINFDYEGVKTVKYLENDIVVGKYSLYMAGTEASEASGSMFRMTFENSVDGNTSIAKMDAEISSYGSIGFEVSVTPESKDAPSIPAGAFIMNFSANGELADEADDKAGAEYVLEMLKEAKTVCEENASSPLVEMVAPLVESGIDYFEQLLTPMATMEDVDQLYNDVQTLGDDILEFYNEHYSIIDVDDELFDTVNQLYINVGSLGDEIDAFTEMEQTLFDEYQGTLDIYGKQFNEFVEKIEQLEEERTNSSADITGIYDLAVVVIADQEIDATALYTSYYLQLSEDGNYLMECEGEIAEGMWAVQDDTVILSNSAGSMYLSLREGDIVYGEEGMEMIFRKR